jgi:hypothetical protein
MSARQTGQSKKCDQWEDGCACRAAATSRCDRCRVHTCRSHLIRAHWTDSNNDAASGLACIRCLRMKRASRDLL